MTSSEPDRADRPTDLGHDAGVDVLIAGAGPTGLTLAAELTAFGVSVKVVDAKAHPVAESRALALQPRTLEVLRGSVTGLLLEHGNRAVRLQWHAGDRTATLPLFDMGMDDTAFPFLLFLSQAETEQSLVDHLAHHHVDVDWNTRLVGHIPAPDGSLLCDLTDATGQPTQVQARYLVGCDGAHSTVREQAGVAFTGGRYPETFLLADTDAEGLEPDTAHVWFGANGPLFFFPLMRPAAWRLLTPRPDSGQESRPRPVDAGPADLDELQSVVDTATDGTVRLATPVWSTAFQIHHRQAGTYRAGSVFLAGSVGAGLAMVDLEGGGPHRGRESNGAIGRGIDDRLQLIEIRRPRVDRPRAALLTAVGTGGEQPPGGRSHEWEEEQWPVGTEPDVRGVRLESCLLYTSPS